jgi:hypothetical protein
VCPWRGLLACLAFVALACGCASASPPPGTTVAVTDIRSVIGRWMGTLIDEHNMGTPLELVIEPDAKYRMRFGATSAAGTVVVQPGGGLAFTMTSGTGLLGPADAASTAVLYDRGGRPVLVGNGRFGLRQRPFSWEVTRQER